MTPKIKCLVFSLSVTALLTGCGRPSNAAKEANSTITAASMQSMLGAKPDNPVHAIVMPHDEPEFPPGPGRDEFVAACVVCHSPRYITMQPRFSRRTWLSEVKKMKDTYGAHISDEEAQSITDYLVSINGKADSGQAPEGTYGE